MARGPAVLPGAGQAIAQLSVRPGPRWATTGAPAQLLGAITGALGPGEHALSLAHVKLKKFCRGHVLQENMLRDTETGVLVNAFIDLGGSYLMPL